MEPGAEVGAYRLIRQIGKEDSLGRVWLAEDRALGRRAAVKVLDPYWSGKAFETLFYERIRSMASISEPGLVQIFDFGQHPDGSFYIAMERLEGEVLEERLQRSGRLPVLEAVRLLQQAVSSLSVLHGRGISHGDIEPKNIFLVPDPQVDGGARAKLLELSVFMRDRGPPFSTHTTAIILRDPAYMSPEELRGVRALDPRCDVYSLGCVMFRMVTGEVPYRAESIWDVFAMHLRQPAPAPSSLVPELPPSLDALVLGCLAKEPAKRYPSARELAEDLGRLLAQLTLGDQAGRLVGPSGFAAAAAAAAATPAAATLAPAWVLPRRRDRAGHLARAAQGARRRWRGWWPPRWWPW